MTSTETHPAMAHRCPFCGADPGTPCVSRTSGRETTWPHTRRTRIVNPPSVVAEQREALCCVCGNLRTVSSNYSVGSSDPNYEWNPTARAAGWRATLTLKCQPCGERTRHARLRSGTYRDSDELQQRFILGGQWDDQYPPDRERLRRDYFAQFPRNPNLSHRFYIKPATEAWDAGRREVTALCGAPDTIATDPRTWGENKRKAKRRKEKYDGFVVAEQLSDIEYTDIETGLEWIDMDCVDCCRVSNEQRRAAQRERLMWFLHYFALRPGLVAESDVADLLKHVERLYEDGGGNQPG